MTTTTTYNLEAPGFGMTAYNESSFQMKADATASSYLANTTGKLHFSGELEATLAGVTLNVNSPVVISIEMVNTIKGEWHDGEFKLATTVADEEAAASKAAMQKTESKLTALKAKATAMKAKATDLANHASTLSGYALLMED